MENLNMKTQPLNETERSNGTDPHLVSVVSVGDRRTQVGDVPGGSRSTRAMNTPQTSGSYGGSQGSGTTADTRRIVGVIVTYSWRPEGQLFIVREGKNFIGADRVGDGPGEPLCDILMANDAKMSSCHALILVHHGRYQILDKESANGTFLNEELLLANQGVKLENYSKIRTGSTAWTFVKIEPPEGAERPLSSQPTEAKEETDKKPQPHKQTYVP